MTIPALDRGGITVPARRRALGQGDGVVPSMHLTYLRLNAPAGDLDYDLAVSADPSVASRLPDAGVEAPDAVVVHGAGANVSDESRYGVILTYSAAWLRQEENQYLDVPPDIAASLSPELQRMIGYKMNGAVGFHDPRVRAESLSPAGRSTVPGGR